MKLWFDGQIAQKDVCRTLKYFEHFFVFISAVSDCVLISAFASLVGVPVGIGSSTSRLNTCVLTSTIKRYKSIIK